MRPRTAPVAAVIGVAVLGLSVPAHADPEPGTQPDDAGGIRSAAFLESLRTAGITYSSPSRAIDAARAVCGLVDRGEPGLQVIADLKANNPGFTTDDAARFAAIAADTYCPHQLSTR